MVYRANLNFRLAEGYIQFLLGKGLLVRGTDDRQLTIYALTSRGERLLDLLARVEQELFEPFSNPVEESVGVRSRVSRIGL